MRALPIEGWCLSFSDVPMSSVLWRILIGFLVVLAGSGDAAWGQENPYAVWAHVTLADWDYNSRQATFEMCRAIGIGGVRSDVRFRTVMKPGGEWNYKCVDDIVAMQQSSGIDFLPILGSPCPQKSGEIDPNWTNFVFRTVSLYRGKVPAWEVMNELNIHGFDAKSYFLALKCAYGMVKRADPDAKVVICGFAGISLAMIEELYRLGAARYFDVMNVHIYCTHDIRNQPEGNFDKRLEQLRSLMAKYDDAKKPIWVTETGSPTHFETAESERAHWPVPVLVDGLAVADPERKVRRILVVSELPESGAEEEGAVSLVRSTFGSGYAVSGCRTAEVGAKLDSGSVDALVLSFNWLRFGVDADAVEKFVARGGIVFVCSGISLGPSLEPRADGGFRPFKCDWHDFGSIRAQQGRFRLAARSLKEARIDSKDLKIPEWMKMPAANHVFYEETLLKPGDRMIPLVTVEGRDERRFVFAAVMKFDSDWKGAIVVSSLHNRFWFPRSEARQADQLARTLGLLMAEGVEKVFVYKFRASEKNATNPQEHFGIVHSDLREKPAFAAYRQFIRMRPVGSAQDVGRWRWNEYGEYAPRWKLPGGNTAGMFWSVSGRREKLVDFGGEVDFFDVFGRSLSFQREGASYRVNYDSSPIYFWSRLGREEGK